MRFSPLVLAILLCCVETTAHAAGLKFIDIPADAEGPALSGAAWYPCATPPGQVELRSIVVVPAVKDCSVAGTKLPLVVMSHGKAGWYGGNHDTAEALADAGFVVAAINHPGDTLSDSTRVWDLSVLFDRPADIKRLIDHMTRAWPDHARIDSENVGFFGFSRGGYTGLIVLGGIPDLPHAAALCVDEPGLPFCGQLRSPELPTYAPVHDPRIKAAVLADPAFRMFFSDDSLNTVKTPVQLWASERGGDGVSLDLVEATRENLPVPPDFHLVHAGHFAFVAPCSPEQAAATPMFCIDPDGFDRVAFHKEFNTTVLKFLREHLVGANGQ
ncbi:MAG TPA: alpha/beta hydrolase [Bradyrhizobium sp.]|jgi:predicted dienelactone hydrolase|nr:alpha/beta hydrolase [Bradyrhizobium sp.]